MLFSSGPVLFSLLAIFSFASAAFTDAEAAIFRTAPRPRLILFAVDWTITGSSLGKSTTNLKAGGEDYVLRMLLPRIKLFPRFHDILAAGRQEGVEFGIFTYSSNPVACRKFLLLLPDRTASGNSLLNSFRATAISANKNFMERVRSLLHSIGGDRFDLLLFEGSKELADEAQHFALPTQLLNSGHGLSWRQNELTFDVIDQGLAMWREKTGEQIRYIGGLREDLLKLIHFKGAIPDMQHPIFKSQGGSAWLSPGPAPASQLSRLPQPRDGDPLPSALKPLNNGPPLVHFPDTPDSPGTAETPTSPGKAETPTTAEKARPPKIPEIIVSSPVRLKRRHLARELWRISRRRAQRRAIAWHSRRKDAS